LFNKLDLAEMAKLNQALNLLHKNATPQEIKEVLK
jgi:hypothetical protein